MLKYMELNTWKHANKDRVRYELRTLISDKF